MHSHKSIQNYRMGPKGHGDAVGVAPLNVQLWGLKVMLYVKAGSQFHNAFPIWQCQKQD